MPKEWHPRLSTGLCKQPPPTEITCTATQREDVLAFHCASAFPRSKYSRAERKC